MTETSTKNIYARYRVFIFGQEVTSDVVSVTIQQNDGRAPGTCAITLLSPNDRYLVTPYDMVSLGLIGSVQAAAIKNDVPILDPIQSMIPASKRAANPIFGSLLPILDATKTRVVSAKRGAQNILFQPSSTPGNPNPTSVPAIRYPFQAGKPIFHPNDPVRVFFSDPADPNKWYHQFSGLVSDFTESADANNNNTLTVTAETAAKWLRYGRFTANPGIVDIKSQVVQDTIVQDVQFRTAFASVFNHFTLPEIFYAMLFGVTSSGDASGSTGVAKQLDVGKSPQNSAGLASQANQDANSPIYDRAYSVESPNGVTLARRKYGIGHLDSDNSAVFVYGDADGPDSGREGIPKGLKLVSINSLADYQAELDHTVSATDLIDMRRDGVTSYPDEFINSQNTTTIPDTIRYIGSHPEIYPTDGGRLMMLIPKSLGAARRSIVTNDLTSSFAGLNTEWTTRGEIICDVVDRIQFVFYVSPRGDFCVEFPLYDFMPEQFNHPTDVAKKFGNNYVIGVDDTELITSTFSDAKVMTQAACAPTAVYNYDQSVADNSGILNKAGLQQVVTLWHLIPLYGVRHMPVLPQGYINTTDAAQLYALIALNKANCEAYTQAVECNPFFTAWLNRPYYVQRRNHIGVTRSYTHSIIWGKSGSVNTSFGLGAMRGWDGTVDSEGRMVFTPLGGLAGRPFRYDTLFKQRDATTPNQSVKTPIPADSGDNLGVQPVPRP